MEKKIKGMDAGIEELILKQADGQLSDSEAVFLRAWIETSVDNRNLYLDYILTIEAERILNYESLFEKTRERIWENLDRRIRISEPRNRSRGYGILRYAAAVAVLMGLFYWFWSKSEPETVPELPYTLNVPMGSKAQLLLPDGSNVWLNAGSSISYNRDFGIANRDVKLTGEAYFDVRENTAIPFRIEAEKLKIEVLGTKFNVKSYADDISDRITLLEGSLEVCLIHNPDTKVRIKPDQQIQYTKGEEVFSIKKVRAVEFTSWMSVGAQLSGSNISKKYSPFPNAVLSSAHETMVHNLFFDEEPLGQIIRDLERAFDVRISVRDSTELERKYYGDFRNGESLEEILSVLCRKRRMSYTIDNREIYIKTR